MRSFVIPALQAFLFVALSGGSWAEVERPNLILALEYQTGFIGHNWMLTIDRSGVIQQHILTTKERF